LNLLKVDLSHAVIGGRHLKRLLSFGDDTVAEQLDLPLQSAHLDHQPFDEPECVVADDIVPQGAGDGAILRLAHAGSQFVLPDGNLFGMLEGIEMIGSKTLNRLVTK